MYRNNRWKCDIARISYCSYINLPSVTSISNIRSHCCSLSADFHENNGIIHDVMENIRISSPAEDFNIYFNYDPQSAYTDQNGVRHNEPNFTKFPGKNIAWPYRTYHYFITTRYIFICPFNQ